MRITPKSARRISLVIAGAAGAGVFVALLSYDASWFGSALIGMGTACAIAFYGPRRPGSDGHANVPASEQMGRPLAQGTFGGFRGITASRQPRSRVRDNGPHERR